MLSTYLNNIEKLIADGDTKFALQEFSALFDENHDADLDFFDFEDVRKLIILQSNTFRGVEVKLMKGVINLEEYQLHINRINATLLDCIGRFKSHEKRETHRHDYKEDFDKDLTVKVLTNTIEMFKDIELTINRSLDEYGKEDQEKLIDAIRALLSIKGEIRIRKIKPGSIKMTLRVPEKHAEELLGMVKNGLLGLHDVVDARFAEAEIEIPVLDGRDLCLKSPLNTTLGRKILEASAKMILESGFNQFAFSKLANRIHSTEASIYRYFESKEMVLSYLMTYYWELVNFEYLYRQANTKLAAYTKMSILVGSFLDNRNIHGHLNLDFKELRDIWITHEMDYLKTMPTISGLRRIILEIEAIIEEVNPYLENTLLLALQILRLLTLVEVYSNNFDKEADKHSIVLKEIYALLNRSIFREQ